MTRQASSPGFERFKELAKDFSVLPVWRELLADSLTPVDAFRLLVGDGEGFLLESADHTGKLGRYSFVGRSPAATIVSDGGSVKFASGTLSHQVALDGGILDCLDELLKKFKSPLIEELPPLQGGIVGYLGYDVIREVEKLPPEKEDPRNLPNAVLSIIGELVAFDHQNSKLILIDNVLLPNPVVSTKGNSSSSGDADLERESTLSMNENWLRAAYSTAEDHLDGLQADLEKSIPYPLSVPPDKHAVLDTQHIHRVMSSKDYCDAVLAAKEYIKAGDAFQIVLSQRFDIDLDVDPFDVYRVLRQINPSPYMYFLRQGGVTIVGASPESLVQLTGDRVISRPIAGTRRRGAGPEEDKQLIADMTSDKKELAEHVMLLDLARNDLGRIVEFGTERVEEQMTVEYYSHVLHMTSQVSGRLREGLSPVDVLRATMPAGTVSGAPKVRAMEIIDELEYSKRGPYAGVVGYMDFSGNLDTAIAIRTLVVAANGSASLQAGAGIVADSIPENEDRECLAKAQAVFSAVAGAKAIAEDRQNKALL
ncbi:MAG: chorismate-binding protein [Firmicutes bacterium]|jgi:anthranilate synthase component 1|nr:chorismate-binding protein [Bacillota bacterium]